MIALHIKEQLERTRKSIETMQLEPEHKKELEDSLNEIEQSIANADFDRLMTLISNLNDKINK